MKHKYSDEIFIEAVNSSISIRQVLQKLNIVPAGGNYKTVKDRINKMDISTSHFLGQSANKGKNFGPRRSIEDYLSNKYTIQSFKLKNRLLKEGILEYICNNCGLTEWLNNPVPLELHHKNGKNNNLNNLELLCPNCHALTDNYRGKGK